MALTKEVIEKYKEVFREDYHEELSDEEVREIDTSLVNLFKVIYKPIPKDYQS